MAEETRNIFISHVHEDDEGHGKLKDLLGTKGFDIRDGSINADKPNNAFYPDYMKSEILAPRMQWAGAMIVYIRHSQIPRRYSTILAFSSLLCNMVPSRMAGPAGRPWPHR